MADINNDDPRDLLFLIAKSLAFPLSNMFLGGTGENGEVVLAINPIWADRFAVAFPAVESLQAYLWENAWQPIELWPAGNQDILRAKHRADDDGRVFRAGPTSRPDRADRAVGSGACTPSLPSSPGESQMQSAAVVTAERRRCGGGRRGDGRDLASRRRRPPSGQRPIRAGSHRGRADMTGVECEDCVMPPEMLEQMINDAVAKRVRGEFEPRQSSAIHAE